eukprot:7633358-Karenia_brevis.AAC.1
MSRHDRCAKVVQKYFDTKICSADTALAYCDGRITTDHIIMMERRAQHRETFIDSTASAGEGTAYDYALGFESMKLSEWVANTESER